MLDKKAELEFYKNELYNEVLPFWERYSPDLEYGGVFTCFSNDGGKLLSEDKYIWSQGRMLWVLSRILKRAEIDEKRLSMLRELADKTAEFLMEKSRLENGNCVFLTDRRGERKLSGGVLDASFYADCFVILGTAEYASYKKDYDALAFSLDLYLHTRERVETGNFRTDPYPVPKGYRTHGITMILTNTARTVANALSDLCHPEADEIANQAYAYACDTLDSFTDPDFILHEMVREDGSFDTDSQIGRYVNPGHTIEDCWFMEDEWSRFGDNERHEKTLRVLKNALRLGWDDEFSGVRLFADMEGGAPRGSVPDPTEPMLKKTTEDNGSKLWWVHSEALYSTLLFGNDPEVASWYPRIKDYTFKTFPNRENGRGEWIQIRARDGSPENRIVALPVKDPFHIMRNYLLIIEYLERE
jgi:N-acylglucosamine 2-epimerase